MPGIFYAIALLFIFLDIVLPLIPKRGLRKSRKRDFIVMKSMIMKSKTKSDFLYAKQQMDAFFLKNQNCKLYKVGPNSKGIKPDLDSLYRRHFFKRLFSYDAGEQKYVPNEKYYQQTTRNIIISVQYLRFIPIFMPVIN